ncbi:MAG: hypothetical protein AAFV93_15085 [Chloroflexota bacterium]
MEDTKKYTVLIVDDHAPAAEMVSQIFSIFHLRKPSVIPINCTFAV